MFDPIPAARESVIEQMCEGMLAVGTCGKIVDVNCAAEDILESQAAQLRGCDLAQVLPELGGRSAQPEGTDS